MVRKLFNILILCLFLFPFELFAQRVKISGKVTDEKNYPLEFAMIHVDGQSVYAMSGADGKYSLQCSGADSISLVCSLLGYRTKKVSVVKPQDSVKVDIMIISKTNTIGEVSVKTTRRQTDGMQNLNVKNTQNLASASGNAVEELVKTQMGVSSHSELSSQYNVRGGSFDENCVYLNGIETYRPMLIRSGEQEGLSVINANMVKEIQFSAGGFAAKYGDKMSSVLDITYKRPTHFEANLAASMMGFDGYVGFGNKKFSMMNGLRYKNPRVLLNSFDTNGEYRPSFLDYQNVTFWQPSKSWSLEFIGNVSDNHYNFIPKDRETKFGTMKEAKSFTVYFDGKEKDLFRTYFGAFTISHHFNEKTILSWINTAYSTKEQETYDISGEYWLNETATQSELGVGAYVEHARNFLIANVGETKLMFQTKLKKHSIQAGALWKYESIKENSVEWERRDSSGYNIPTSSPTIQLIYQMRAKTDVNSNRQEFYVQDIYKFQNKMGLFTLNYGLRLSHWDWNSETIVSPRASVALIPSKCENLTLRMATGLYYQSPFYKELRDTVNVGSSTIVSLNKNIKSQRSFQVLLGGDYQFYLNKLPYKFSTELYYKHIDNLVPYNVNNLRVVYYGRNMGQGDVIGIDFKLYGEFVPGTDSWITFGLMSAKQTIDGQKLSMPTDQRYNFNLFFTDYFPNSDRWKMSLKASLADGLPFGAPHKGIGEGNFRAPAYKRVDIGLSYLCYRNESRKPEPASVKKVWLGVDALNILGINNVNSYYWVTDVRNTQYAVPNFLTGRLFNVKCNIEF